MPQVKEIEIVEDRCPYCGLMRQVNVQGRFTTHNMHWMGEMQPCPGAGLLAREPVTRLRGAVVRNVP